jgi:hypothetical protein
LAAKSLPFQLGILGAGYQEDQLQLFIRCTMISLLLTTSVSAQKLVDPTSVAPEYREAAEKRRAEQVKQRECAKKADIEKIMPRERTAYLLQCLETDANHAGLAPRPSAN